MSLEALLKEVNALCAAEKKDGIWSYNACRKSSLLHEEVIERDPPSEYVDKDILPALRNLKDMFKEVKLENSFVRYIPGFLDNVIWRISELEKFVSKKKEKEKKDSKIFSTRIS